MDSSLIEEKTGIENQTNSDGKITIHRESYQNRIGMLFVFVLFPSTLIICLYYIALAIQPGIYMNLSFLLIILFILLILIAWYNESVDIGNVTVVLNTDYIQYTDKKNTKKIHFLNNNVIIEIFPNILPTRMRPPPIRGVSFSDSNRNIAIHRYTGWSESNIIAVLSTLPQILNREEIQMGKFLTSYIDEWGEIFQNNE